MKQRTFSSIIIISVIILIVVSFFFVPTFNLSNYRGISIESNNFDETDGHIDMLVPRSDFEDQLRSTINPAFIDEFPNYATFDYLYIDNSEWVSYSAYVEDAYFSLFPQFGHFYFATGSVFYELELDDIKFIHVDADGNTVSVSYVYSFPKRYFYKTIEDINYNITSNEFSSEIEFEFHSELLIWDILMSIIFGLLFAYPFFRKNKDSITESRTIYLFESVVYSIAFFIIVPFLNQYFKRFTTLSDISLILDIALLFIILFIDYKVIKNKYSGIFKGERYLDLRVTYYFYGALLAFGGVLILLVYRTIMNLEI